MLGFKLEADEIKVIQSAEKEFRAKHKAISVVLDRRSNTGWTTSGHTAIDVQVFAMGKGKEQFAGHIDNTDIPKVIFNMLEQK